MTARLQLIEGGGDIVAACEDLLARAKSGEVVGVVLVGISEPDGVPYCGWTWAIRNDVFAGWARLQAAVDTAQHELVADGLD